MKRIKGLGKIGKAELKADIKEDWGVYVLIALLFIFGLIMMKYSGIHIVIP